VSQSGPVVEVLSFAGCPNRDPAIALVQAVIDESQVDAELRVIDVEDESRARELRFLGSPTIKINGRDIEPGADTRRDYSLSCRVYRTEAGLRGQPDGRWLRETLAAL